eukprot:12549543-Alexandrium_andersonii.AAC.1
MMERAVIITAAQHVLVKVLPANELSKVSGRPLASWDSSSWRDPGYEHDKATNGSNGHHAVATRASRHG